MSVLADEAGDWRGHLPYAAAVGYLDNSQYRKEYGEHVDDCSYCRQLIDALHPREDTVSDFLDVWRNWSEMDEPPHEAADALIEARSSLDAIRHVILASPHNAGVGTLRHWAKVQQGLTDVQMAIDGPNSFAADPWSATIALSLDAPSGPVALDKVDDWIASDAEQVASFLLACGFRVAHASDLRSDGISGRLLRLARRYGRRMSTEVVKSDAATVPRAGFGITSYCAWPVHIRMPIEELETYVMDFGGSGDLNFLTLDGEPHSYKHFWDSDRRDPVPDEWIKGMSTLRTTMVGDSFARVAIGGGTGTTKGRMPSLAQDALSSLQNQQPLYILAGLGGCARDIASALQLTDSRPSSQPEWQGLDEFAPYVGSSSLNNGLDVAENQSLAETDDVEEAMQLVLLGLDRISKSQQDSV